MSAPRHARGPRTGLAVTNTWPPMSAGSGRAFHALLEDATDVVALVPRDGAAADDPAWVRRALRFSGRSGGPLRIRTLLQHAEIVLAPSAWAVRHGRPSFVFVSQPLFSGVGALLLGGLAGVPYAVMVHGEEVGAAARSPDALRARLLRTVLRRAAAVVCNAEHTRALVRDFAGLPADRLHVVRPPVSLSELGAAGAPPSTPGGPPMLLMAGRLWQAHKGFDRMIEALPAVRARHPDVRLVIAGPGDTAPYERLAASLGVADAVRFAGEVPRAELLRLFAACTAFVMPGREVAGGAEGFGIAYLEAAAMGKPSVAGRAGGAPEAVIDGVTGLLVDGDDPAAVAAACARLLDDPALATRLGAAGRQRVVEQFDGRAQRAATRRILDAMVGVRPVGARSQPA